MEFDIYSIGDSEFLEQVLIALAMIAGVDDFGAMVQVGMAVGVLSVIFSAIAKGGKEIEFQHILLGYILWATMFVPTARVTIEDTYTGDVRVVDNVPMGPAAAGGIISLIGYKVTELFEVAYGPIVPKVTETEFAESLRLINNLRNKASNEAVWDSMNLAAGGGFIDLQRSWVNYMKDCTLKKVDLNIINLSQLSRLPYDDALRFDSVLFGTQVYLEAANPNGQNLTCTEAFPDLLAATNYNHIEVQNTFNQVLGLNGNNTQAGVTHIAKTQSALDALFGAGEDAQRMMETAVLEPILMRAAQGKYDALNDVAGSAMVNQAIHQRNTTWATEQSLFMSIVRPMLAFFEAFTYAVAPVMAFVIVLGAKGIQLAAKYFTLMIWIQLWMPLLAICNLYIYTASRRELDVYAASGTHNWDSFYALNGAAETAQNWIATGGMLASSTPAIALMLIYGSAVTATHLAGRLKSGAEIDPTTGGSPEIMKQGPVLGANVGYQGDMTSGVVRSGAQADDFSINTGYQLSNLVSSSSAAADRHLASFQQGIGASIRNSDGQSFNWENVSSLGDSATALSGSEKGIYNSAMQAVEQGYGQSFANDRHVQGLVSAYASGGISSKELLKGIDLAGGGQYSMADSARNSESTSRQEMTKDLEGLDVRSGDKAAFSEQLASQLTNSTGTGGSKQWASDDTATSARGFTSSAEQAEQYSEQASRLNQAGVGGTFTGNTVAAAIASDSQAFNGLRENFKALSDSNPGLNAAMQQTYQNAQGRFGSDEQRLAYSMLRAMTQPGAYNHDSSERDGVAAVMSAMDQSLTGYDGSAGPLPGGESRNVGVGSSAPASNSGNPLGGIANSPTISSPGSITAPSSGLDGVTSGNAAGLVQTHNDQSGLQVSSRADANNANLASNEAGAVGAFQHKQSDRLITDLNQDVANNDLADNAALGQIKGGAENVAEFVQGQGGVLAGAGWEGAKAANAEFGQQMSNLGNMSPSQVAAFNDKVESQFQNTSGFGAFVAAAKEHGMSTAGFLQNILSGGEKPDGMSYSAYSQYNETAAGMAIASGQEAFAAHAEQLSANEYQAKLAEAHQAGLPAGSNAAAMYASAHSTSFSDFADKMWSPEGALTAISPAMGVAAATGLAKDWHQSQGFTDAHNAMKMEFVPQNVDNNGYEYNMVDGQKEYVTGSDGERVQHFTRGTNDHGHDQITLTNQKYEDYTNNAAEIVKHGAYFGGGSDTEGGMIRLSQVEQMRH